MTKAIYSFPEPEKTSSWKADLAVEMVDHELLDAERRTALIKAKMSPPGALRIPPLVEKRRLEYGIPDGAFKCVASFDRIFVFPIDPVDGDEKEKTTGGIWKPNSAKLRDFQEGHRGVLISAGLTALDRLSSHGIALGHIVMSNKNVPFARRIEMISNIPMYILVMRDGDLCGSETIAEEIQRGERRIVEVPLEDGSYQHQIEDRLPGGDSVVHHKMQVYVNDTW